MRGEIGRSFMELLLSVFLAAPLAAMIVATAAVPVVVTMATASWALGLKRLRILLAVLVGMAAGAFAAVPFGFVGYPNFPFLEDFPDPWEAITTLHAAMAATAGTVGSGIALRRWAKKLQAGAGCNQGPARAHPLQFARILRFGVLGNSSCRLGRPLPLARAIAGRQAPRRNRNR